MKLTFLGTGDAAGVPVAGCSCQACANARRNELLIRRACSALVESDGRQILIDAGLTDLTRLFPIGSLDAIFLTHFHMDHVQGLFHYRWGLGEAIPVYCPNDSQGCDDLYKHPGILAFHQQSKFAEFEFDQLRITPVPLIHSKPTLGYCFDDGAHRLAYLTDTADLPEKTLSFLQEWQPDDVVLDNRFPPAETTPRNHNDLNTSLRLHDAIQPSRATYLTHIGHELDLWFLGADTQLPETVRVAQDGMIIESQTG